MELPQEVAEDTYQHRIGQQRNRWNLALRQKNKALWAFRLCTALAFLSLAHAFLWYPIDQPGRWSFVCGMLFAIAAFFANRRIEAARRRCDFAKDMHAINRQGLARRHRRWESIPEHRVRDALESLPLSRDIDLFGHASLMQLVCTAETDRGIETLAQWLTSPADVATIIRRQQLTQQMSPELDWRQTLQYRCRLIGNHGQQNRDFIAWGSQQVAFQIPGWVRVVLIAVPVVFCAALATMFFNLAVGSILLGLLIVANFAMTVIYSGSVHQQFHGILITPEVPSYDYLSGTFDHVARCETLARCQPDFTTTAASASTAIKSLEKILMLEVISRNALSMLFIYIPLQFLLLWDLQTYRFAEQWRHRYGSSLEGWFDSLGEVEAISSLANLAYEQPDWAFAKLETNTVPCLEARQLGHPLLPDSTRINNDLTVGPPGTTVLITGSNMGGKSTLLRAVACNVILAQSGAPCPCESLQTTPLDLQTSMRVSDSLTNSESFFVAQLQSLKTVVDRVQQAESDPQRLPVLYLFDEILDGTNTIDRRIAVEGLLEYFLRCRTIGVLTTHDLQIATDSKHRDAFQPFYLTHKIDAQNATSEMRFDYKLHPGIASQSNALHLVKALGLPLPD